MDFRSSVGDWVNRRAFWLALGITLLGVVLRLCCLTRQSLWYDELISVNIATLAGGLSSILRPQFYPHPPLFVLLLHGVFGVLNPSDFSARLVPVMSGIVSLPLFYGYLADITNRRTALIGLALLALSPFHIYHSQDARPYTLIFALVVATSWVLYRALQSNRWYWWLAHALCLLALLQLHFFSWCVLGGEVLYMLLTWRRHKSRLVPFALSLLVVPLALPPVLGLLQDSDKAGHVLVLNAVPDSIGFWSTWMTTLTGDTRYASGFVRATGAVALAAAAVVGGIQMFRRKPQLLAWMLSMITVPFVFVFVMLPALGHIVPPYEEKLFMVILPFALALAAFGFDTLLFGQRARPLNLAGRLVGALLLVIIFAGNLIALQRYYTSFEKNADIRVIEYLQSQVSPGDLIVADGLSMGMNLSYHWDADVPAKLVGRPRLIDGQWLLTEDLRLFLDRPARWDVTMQDILSYPNVWLVAQDGFGSQQLSSELQTLAPAVHVERIGPFIVYLLHP
jgi:uncharacterized membrane protein